MEISSAPTRISVSPYSPATRPISVLLLLRNALTMTMDSVLVNQPIQSSVVPPMIVSMTTFVWPKPLDTTRVPIAAKTLPAIPHANPTWRPSRVELLPANSVRTATNVLQVCNSISSSLS